MGYYLKMRNKLTHSLTNIAGNSGEELSIARLYNIETRMVADVGLLVMNIKFFLLFITFCLISLPYTFCFGKLIEIINS